MEEIDIQMNKDRMMELLEKTVEHIQNFEDDVNNEVLSALGFTKLELAEITGEMYTIHELKGDALIKALNDTREAEEFSADETLEELIVFNDMTGSLYDVYGEFVTYESCL